MKLRTVTQERLERGTREQALTLIGVPPIHQMLPETGHDTRLKAFLQAPPTPHNTIFLISCELSEDSYALGSRLATLAFEARIPVAEVGLTALLNFYKSTFQDEDRRARLHSLIRDSQVLVIANVSKAKMRLWDGNNLVWLRSTLKQRESLKKKTVICMNNKLERDSLSKFVDLDAVQQVDRFKLADGKKPYGKN